MGLFSKIKKIDPLAGRAMKDTAKVTKSVKSAVGSNTAARPAANATPTFGTAAHMQALRGKNKESGPVKTVAAKPSSVSGAMGSVVAAVASRKPAAKPVAKPKPAPVKSPLPDMRKPTPVKSPLPDMRKPTPVKSPLPDMRKPTPVKSPPPDMRKPTIGKTR